MLLDFERYPLREAHEKIVAFCERNGIDALDLLPVLRGEDAAALTVFLDGHPNGTGHALFAEAIFAHLDATGLVLPAEH